MNYDEFVNTCEQYAKIVNAVEYYIDTLWKHKYFDNYSEHNKITFEPDFYDDRISFSQTLIVKCEISTQYDNEYIGTHYINIPITYFNMSLTEKNDYINSLIIERNKSLEQKNKLQEILTKKNKLLELDALKQKVIDLENELA